MLPRAIPLSVFRAAGFSQVGWARPTMVVRDDTVLVGDAHPTKRSKPCEATTYRASGCRTFGA